MSVATFVEVSIVVESQTGDSGGRQWDQFFRLAGFALEPVTEEQAYAARQAWSDFGKGRSGAKLNFGDCFRTPWQKPSTNHFFSRAMISLKLTLRPRPDSI